MFDGSSNIQLTGKISKVHYPKFIFLCAVEHTVSLFLYYVSKIPLVCQIIYVRKLIQNIFGSGIYNNPHSILKLKYQEFYNKNIGIFCGNDTRMAGYFMEMHRDSRMSKVL